MKEEDKIEEFIRESNAIEGVYDEDSFYQAKYAWTFLADKKSLSHSIVLKTHKILMLHQPLLPNEKGYYRRVPVYIGNKRLSWENVENRLDDWIDDMNFSCSDISNEALENQSKAFHVEYEKIHPFVDGNGRTGRMFMNWWRLKNGLPLLIIKARERQHYYKWFK